MSLIDNLKNAIENRISSLISSHNTNSNAHSSILSTVAKTGDYTDLSNKPAVDSALSTISSNAIQNQTVTNALNNKSNSDHNHNDVYYTENEVDGLISAHNTNSNAHNLAAVATSGSYNDLTDKPSKFTVDSSLSSSSTNPVQNKVVKNALDNKANSTHSHTWSSQAVGSYGILKINTDIRLCILQYNREVTFPTANSTKTVASGAIPSSYRPSSTIIGSTYNPAVAMGINNSGDILMRASSATTSAVAVNCTTIWNY